MVIGTSCPLADRMKAVDSCLSAGAVLLGETEGEVFEEAFRLRRFLPVENRELRSRLILFLAW